MVSPPTPQYDSSVAYVVLKVLPILDDTEGGNKGCCCCGPECAHEGSEAGDVATGGDLAFKDQIT